MNSSQWIPRSEAARILGLQTASAVAYYVESGLIASCEFGSHKPVSLADVLHVKRLRDAGQIHEGRARKGGDPNRVIVRPTV